MCYLNLANEFLAYFIGCIVSMENTTYFTKSCHPAQKITVILDDLRSVDNFNFTHIHYHDSC